MEVTSTFEWIWNLRVFERMLWLIKIVARILQLAFLAFVRWTPKHEDSIGVHKVVYSTLSGQIHFYDGMKAIYHNSAHERTFIAKMGFIGPRREQFNVLDIKI